MLKELDLSGCKTGGEIEGLTEEFESLEFLDFSNSNITTLKTFPKLPNLRKLDFSGNRLSKGLENLKECTNLKHLIISNNRIREMDVLEPLKSLEHLTHLEVGLDSFEAPLARDQPELRMKIFELLPSLQYLDQTDIDGNEEDEDDEGILNGKILDDVSDGDDELEDEEGEEDEEDDEDSEEEEEEVGNNLSTLYTGNGVLQEDDDEDEDYNEDASDDEEEEDEDPEPEQSTRGKKRKLDDRPV